MSPGSDIAKGGVGFGVLGAEIDGSDGSTIVGEVLDPYIWPGSEQVLLTASFVPRLSSSISVASLFSVVVF